MAISIRPLPTEVVHHIAAGEVIDSWAAVVRELAENSLDAGATRIQLSFWPKLWSLRLADNGVGMSLADLRQAATPHSTSKIRTQDDLWRIDSLGFRGEALHSLAQAGDLEICSRRHQLADVSGWRLAYGVGGEITRQETVAIAPGTIVTVSNLFDPWPARRQGLPNLNQQLRAVQRTIQQLALCHPQVTWQAELDDRPWFSLAAAESPRELLPQMLRSVAPSDLRETTLTLGEMAPAQLYLLVGLPDRCHRHHPDWVRIAVNGRPITLPELEQAIIRAFRFTLPRDRHPVCFVHLRPTPDEIDWNRHPNKSTIYLHHLDRWIQAIHQGIESVLRLHPESLSDRYQQQRVDRLLKTAESGGRYSLSDNLPLPERQNPLPELRVVAQVQNRYILAEHDAGISLIEQHIAHERVIYERLRQNWKVLTLETPVILGPLSKRQVQQLDDLGLEVEPFGAQQWLVRTAPAPLAQREDLPDALLELSLGRSLETALVATACRTAIRNGTPLDLPTMRQLVHDWRHTQNPHTCPHGRPICLTLQETNLARFFRRNWVVGKSHGLEQE